MTGADRLQELHAHFIADASAGRSFPGTDATTLFEAWLEVHEIAPDDFGEDDWIEFLRRIGITDSQDQDCYLIRLSEWGGVVHADREAAAAASQGGYRDWYGMVGNPSHGSGHAPYQTHIIGETKQNTDFRRVLHTGQRMQLVVMSIPPDGDIGMETHAHVEQMIFVQSGHGRIVIGDSTRTLATGDVVVVPAGMPHNVLNESSTRLQLYTVYGPPNHIDGRVHVTRAASDADDEDEAFGERVR